MNISIPSGAITGEMVDGQDLAYFEFQFHQVRLQAAPEGQTANHFLEISIPSGAITGFTTFPSCSSTPRISIPSGAITGAIGEICQLLRSFISIPSGAITGRRQM